MQGLLLTDKPAGWTSFDVVNYVRKIVATEEGKRTRNVKVGHTGTLDPFATGLLILLVGKEYTRKATSLTALDKTYEVVVQLGQTSTTGDPEGDLTKISDTVPDVKVVHEVVSHFKGLIEQIPPAYSAIKIDGQRAYNLARAGKQVTIEPRKITINRLEVTNYQYPKLWLTADVSSGTYIRSLVNDIGQALGTGAYTTELRRSSIGHYSINDAESVTGLTAQILSSRLIKLG